MKVVMCAGPPASGKSTVLRQATRSLTARGLRLAYLKIDVQYADEDEIFHNEFGIPTHKVYSGDLCPDHCSVLVMGDAIKWAEQEQSDILLVETAGLCLRCAPYIEGTLGMVVLEATSGMSLPRKIGAMLTLADIAVVTKIDMVSQAEKEVFRANIMDAASAVIIETDALHGIGMDRVVSAIENSQPVKEPLLLKGSPPMATCTICVGKREIGWEKHSGLLRTLDSGLFYKGQ
ncbi:MAG: GTP-binding protein [Mariprofundaceae bacterium]|nr:GTP-binding protein [Mariprofundaceae bacterium]